ncbi:MAG: hypothetical protein MJ252_00785 [archaeon]|nr:hypothetical protein [archaeon]
MGNDLKCQFGESEQEIIERIFSSLPFNKVDLGRLTYDLNETIIESDRLSSYSSQPSTGPIKHIPKITMSFNTDKINSYLEKYVNVDENKCNKIHMTYFNNVLHMKNNVLILSTILVSLCRGDKDEKVKYLSELYEKGNLLIDKDLFKFYLYDIIKANSVLCVNSCRNFLGEKSSKLMDEIYSEYRRKKLCDFILSNYTIAFNEVFRPKEVSLTDSVVIDDTNIKKFISALFDLIFPSLKGDFIRNWLSEEYERDKPSFLGTECCGGGVD